MGLLAVAIAYLTGKSLEKNRRDRERDRESDFYDEVCKNCDHRRSQHDDDGTCPTYFKP